MAQVLNGIEVARLVTGGALRPTEPVATSFGYSTGDALDEICDEISMLRGTIAAGGYSGIPSRWSPASASQRAAPVPPSMATSRFAGSGYPLQLAEGHQRPQIVSPEFARAVSSAEVSLPPSPLVDRAVACLCGSVFTADMEYCRSCGRARETFAPFPDLCKAQVPVQRPVAETRPYVGYGCAASSSAPSRLRLNHTLWEERQIERCFRLWVHVASGGFCGESLQPSSLGIQFSSDTERGYDCGSESGSLGVVGQPLYSYGSGGGSIPVAPRALPQQCSAVNPRRQLDQVSNCSGIQLGYREASPSPDSFGVGAVTTRVDLCFRVWRRLCAARRAEEIGASVRLLNIQVSRQMRRTLSFWTQLAEARSQRRAGAAFAATTMRASIQWWAGLASSGSNLRKATKKAQAALRFRALRRASLYWAAWAASKLLSNAFRERQCLRIHRLAMQSWLSYLVYRREKASEANTSAEAMQAVVCSIAMRQWASNAKLLRRKAKLEAISSRHMVSAPQAYGLRMLAENVHMGSGFNNFCAWAEQELLSRRKRLALRSYASWTKRRGRRKRTLRGHVETRVQPQMLRTCLQLWISLVRRKQRHASALRKANLVMGLALKSRTFGGWLIVSRLLKQGTQMLAAFASSTFLIQVSFMLALWRAQAQDERMDRQMHERASAQEERASLSRSFALFREGIAAQRNEAIQVSKAAGHSSRTSAASAFRSWRLGAHAAKTNRAMEVGAEKRRSTNVVKTAMDQWKRYRTSRRAKSRTRQATEAAAALAKLRRASCVARWSGAHRAGRLRDGAVQRQASSAARAVFAWGLAVRDERRRISEVVARGENVTRIRTMAAMRGLLQSKQMRDLRHLPGAVRSSFSCWAGVVRAQIAQAVDRVAAGLRAQSIRLYRLVLHELSTWALMRRELRRQMAKLSAAVGLASKDAARRAEAYTLDIWWTLVENGRDVDAAQLRYNQTQQKELCFQCWLQFCTQQGHKRSVIVVCGTYRDGRRIQTAFRSWHSAHQRLCAIAEHVLVWAAGLATQRVELLVWAWRGVVERGKRCTTAAAEVTLRRQGRAVASWRSGYRSKVSIQLVLNAFDETRQRSWLRLWLRFAQLKQAERRREKIATEDVTGIRQRSWIDRWCEAGRWHRLGHVAEAWDKQVFSKQALAAAHRAWYTIILRRKKGEEVASRVAALRASLCICGWAQLGRTLGERPRSLLREVFVAWRQTCRQLLGRNRAVRRLPLQQGFRQLQANQRRRQECRQVEKKAYDLAAYHCSARCRKDAIGWWKRWSLGIQRKMRGWRSPQEAQKSQQMRMLQGGLAGFRARVAAARPLKAAEAAKLPQIQQLRSRQRQRVIDRWHDSLQHRNAIRFRRARDAMPTALEGGANVTVAFASWATLTRRRLDSRAFEHMVRAKMESHARAHIFDQWAKAYEFESSCFYAGRILGPPKLIRRIITTWQKLAAFSKRFDAHVAHVQVLQDTQLLRQACQQWQNNLRAEKQIEVFWMDRWRSWSRALLTEWRKIVRERRRMREAFGDLRAWTRSQRSRQHASAVIMGKCCGLLRRSFEALRMWVQKLTLLEARSVALKSKVIQGRQLRRMCSWAMCARAWEKSLSPFGGLDRVLAAWAVAHRNELTKAKTLSSISFRRTSSLAIQVLEPWREVTVENLPLRRAERRSQESRRHRLRSEGLLRWSCLAKANLRRRTSLQRHLWQRDANVLSTYLLDWRKEVRTVRASRSVARGQDLRGLQSTWQAWRAALASSAHKRKCGNTVANLRFAQVMRILLALWSRFAATQARARGLFECLHRITSRWTSESQWRVRATRDPTLQSMFSRFTTSFDMHHRSIAAAERQPAFERQALESIVSFIWERQQLSVAMGRLKGYPQRWVLGMWCSSTTPFLPVENPYYKQTELRLSAMVSLIQDQRSLDYATSLYNALYARAGGCRGFGADERFDDDGLRSVGLAPDRYLRLCMWHALADLVVVCHPGWPENMRSSVGSLAKHPAALLYQGGLGALLQGRPSVLAGAPRLEPPPSFGPPPPRELLRPDVRLLAEQLLSGRGATDALTSPTEIALKKIALEGARHGGVASFGPRASPHFGLLGAATRHPMEIADLVERRLEMARSISVE